MASDTSIVVADPANLTAIRDGASLPGRVMLFASTSLGSAMESIRAYRPKIVAIDANAVRAGHVAFGDERRAPGSQKLAG